MTPAQRHRAEVWQRYAPDGGDPACIWHPDGSAPECYGPLQSCHIYSAQRLKIDWRNARRLARDRRPHNEALAAVPLDDLIADGRNGVPGRAVCHGRNEGPVLHVPYYPEEFLIFLADFQLEHVIDYARSAA